MQSVTWRLLLFVITTLSLSENSRAQTSDRFFGDLGAQTTQDRPMTILSQQNLDGLTSETGRIGDFGDVCFIDSDRGWAVGDNGLIMATTDGGMNWVRQTSPTTENLKGVSFFSATSGWAVGETGTILRWDGDAWHVIPTYSQTHIFDVHAVGEAEVFIPQNQSVLHTTDGGETWNSERVVWDNCYLLGMHYVHSENMWAFGGHSSAESTLSSIRRWNGHAWQQVNCPQGGHLIWDVDFVDAQYGWLVGYNQILMKTVDGGDSWAAIDWTYGDWGLMNVDFVDPFNGWLVTVNGRIYHSQDGGETWQSQGWIGAECSGLHMFDVQTGWVAGHYGTLLRTTDGGERWLSADKPRLLAMGYFRNVQSVTSGVDAASVSLTDHVPIIHAHCVPVNVNFLQGKFQCPVLDWWLPDYGGYNWGIGWTMGPMVIS